jgi:hypothetical protein
VLVLAAGCGRCASPSTATATAPRSALLATIPEGVQPSSVAPPAVIGLHAETSTTAWMELLFSSRGGGVAFVAGARGSSQVFHNGRPSRLYAVIGDVVLSPDGSRVAFGALVDGRWRMVVDGVEGPAFEAVDSPLFSPDGAHLVYEAMAGESWHLVVDGVVGPATPTRYLAHAFSGDSSRLLFVEDLVEPAEGRHAVSDLAFTRPRVAATGVEGMVLDPSGRRVASVCEVADGHRVLTLELDRDGDVTSGPLYDDVLEPVFGPDGAGVAYVAARGGLRLAVLDGREEPLPPGSLRGPLVVRPRGGVGALVEADGFVRLHELLGEPRRASPAYDDASDLTYGPDGRSYAFAARRGPSWFVVVDGSEGPPFDKVVTPRVSPDGTRVVYRARKDGRRFVVVADLAGRTLQRHASYEQVYPTSFTADGTAVAYGVKDAARVLWKVEPL